MARRDKYGILPPPPVKRGTVVRLRENRTGRATNQRAIVMRNVPPSDFSRAYGRQVIICTYYGKGGKADVFASEKGAGDLIPVGVVKKIPKACKLAVAEYMEEHAPLFKRRRR